MNTEHIDDLDPECRALVEAINRLPGIYTTSSCCGHGKHPYWIFFRVENVEALPALLYWLDPCHNGCARWVVTVNTDCSRSPASFCIEGPVGDTVYEDAETIAACIASEGAAHDPA